MSWEESARREKFESKYLKVKTDLAVLRDNHTKVITEKDAEIKKLKDEAEERKLLFLNHRSKMSDLKSDYEKLKREYKKKEDELVNEKTLHKKFLDKADRENALAYSLGFRKLKEALLRDFSNLDLSAYNPPEVVDDPMEEDADEEEEDEEEEENEEEVGRTQNNVEVEGGDQPTIDGRQEEEEEVEID